MYLSNQHCSRHVTTQRGESLTSRSGYEWDVSRLNKVDNLLFSLCILVVLAPTLANVGTSGGHFDSEKQING